jgi:hypothetical protein
MPAIALSVVPTMFDYNPYEFIRILSFSDIIIRILDAVLFREQRKFIRTCNAYFQYKTKIECNSGCAD